MPVQCVVGVQWGDEGKGKIVDLLTREHDVIVRYQGGANAGHTVVVGPKEFVLHLLPSGILWPGKRCVIGNGVVVDPETLLSEIDALRRRGISCKGRLFISDRAHLVLPFHKALDVAREKAAKSARIGTTGRGIGPAYADKASRLGIRIVDLWNPRALRERLRASLAEKRRLLSGTGIALPSAAALTRNLNAMAKRIRPFVRDTSAILQDAVRQGQRILLEGAQGILLDLDHGTYPFVTSSSSLGGPVGAGIPASAIRTILGVAKAYCTRVGAGPFPTEIPGALGDRIRDVGHEFGATTGRPRRCGWFDAVAARYAIRIGGVNALAITKIDVLDAIDPIHICVGYRLDGRRIDTIPADVDALARVRPIYERLPGWGTALRGVSRFRDLPAAARRYIRFLEEAADCPVRMVSVGRDRAQIIFR